MRKVNLPGIADLSGYAVTPTYGENLNFLSGLFFDDFQMPSNLHNSTHCFTPSLNHHFIFRNDSHKSRMPNVTFTTQQLHFLITA